MINILALKLMNYVRNCQNDLKLLRHISPYLKQRHKLIFYLAAIKPVMLYLSPIWSSCSKELLERVLGIQKRAACIILDTERTTRTLTMYNELNWIPFVIETNINRCSIQPLRDQKGATPDYINYFLLKFITNPLVLQI